MKKVRVTIRLYRMHDLDLITFVELHELNLQKAVYCALTSFTKGELFLIKIPPRRESGKELKLNRVYAFTMLLDTEKDKDVSFESMIQKGIQRRLSEGKIKEWTDEYQKRMEHELKIMTDMGYVDYHKVVEDFCREGRILGKIPKDRIDDIPEDYSLVHEWINREGFEEGVGIGPGRGSAVGSLVCFVIGITNIDPLRYGLLFERFLNPERVSMPDIDTDIATRLRPTLIRYLKWKYGERAVCSIATENTYAAKASIQMAGRDRASQKYANLPKKEYDYMCRSYLKKYTLPLSDQIPEEPGMTLAKCEEDLRLKIESNEESRIIWKHAKLIEGKLQGTGVHAGGVIISDNDNINDYIPLAYNTDKNVWAAQCDMIVAEEKGLLKMDVLGLGTLDCMSILFCIYSYSYFVKIKKRRSCYD